MMKRFAFLLLPLILFSCSCKGGQNAGKNSPVLIGDTVSEIHDSILCVFQDTRNAYWFGSNGYGVYRYDGKTLLHFSKEHGLSGNRIWQISEDQAGNILVNTTEGISKFNGQSFVALKAITDHSPGNGWKLQATDLWFVGAQDSGLVYRYDGETLYRLQFPKTKVAEDFITEHPREKFPQMQFNPYDVYSIYKDRKGNLWFGTGMLGICWYNGKSFTWIPNSEIGMDEIALGVRSMIEDKNGKFWFSNTKHRYRLSEAGKKIHLKKEPGLAGNQGENEFDYFMSGLTDANGDFWLATYNEGVWRYDGKKMINYRPKKDDFTVNLFSIYKDKTGRLWLGTHTDGVYCFNGKTFEKFSPWLKPH